MKKCPSCNQLFSDDNYFCLNDGTTLLFVSETGSNLPVFPTADNATTQVVSRPQIPMQVSTQIPMQTAPQDSSKWLFLIIGILATALIGMGIFMFARRGEKEEKKETANENAKTENSSENTNRAENDIAKNTPKVNQTIEKSQINPNLNPAGSWSGDLSYPSGASFSGQADLTDEGGGRVRGQIVWTFIRGGNRSRAEKVGLSATEFVQGNYDAATRTLLLKGYSKSDANDLIILDKYRLILGEDNRRMNGYSFGGKTRGNFNLRK